MTRKTETLPIGDRRRGVHRDQVDIRRRIAQEAGALLGTEPRRTFPGTPATSDSSGI